MVRKFKKLSFTFNLPNERNGLDLYKWFSVWPLNQAQPISESKISYTYLFIAMFAD